VLVLAGVCMGIANANLTDLALGLGGAERRTTTAAFNLVRWGFAAPAPVIAGLLHPVSATAPYWVGAGVLLIGVVAFAWKGRAMASAVGERLTFRQWDRAARAVEGTPEEALGEV
jgi:hypothetical protein